jgi:hypothetical protein
MCQSPKSQNDLPSWVPDWCASIRAPFGTSFLLDTPFSASGKRLVYIDHIDDNDKVIALQGVRVDEVDAIGTAWMPLLEDSFNFAAVGQLLTEIDQFCNEALNLSNGTYQDPRVLDEARWRTAIGDKESTEGDVSMPQRATQSSFEGNKEMRRRIELIEAAPNIPPDQRRAFMNNFDKWSVKESSYMNYRNSCTTSDLIVLNKDMLG